MLMITIKVGKVPVLEARRGGREKDQSVASTQYSVLHTNIGTLLVQYTPPPVPGEIVLVLQLLCSPSFVVFLGQVPVFSVFSVF